MKSIARKAGKLLAPLTPDALLKQARRLTGLNDFGGNSFMEPLGILCQSLEDDSRLTSIGRIAAHKDAVRMLMNRLGITAARKTDSSIAVAPVEKPIFIVGLPRTGTTILHNLMAQDPDSRCPLSWEVMYPCPAPDAATYETDKRIAKADKDMRWLNRLAPDFKKIHPVAARLPQECISITAHEFMSMQFPTMYRVPSYYEWLDNADKTSAYHFHKVFLQHLQSRNARRRWVLKAPGHLDALDALLAVYPDARIIFTHRNPGDVIASLASLIVTLHRAFSKDVDPGEVGPVTTRRWAEAMRRALQVRDRETARAGQFLDISYNDFLEDQIGTIAGIYDHFGVELTRTAKAAMENFLGANPKDKHGRHRYSLEAFGLNADEERERFSFYTERFNIAAT